MKIQDISRFDKILIVATVLLLIAMCLWYNKGRYQPIGRDVLNSNTGKVHDPYE